MFNIIGIISKQEHPRVEQTLNSLLNFLHSRGCQILLDENSCRHLDKPPDNVKTLAQIGTTADTVIVIGGDGTFLAAARDLSPYQIPLLGINLGRLGFLVDICPTDIDVTLANIFDGHYDSEYRTLLNMRITHNGEVRQNALAFNDVVLHKWNTARMIEFEILIDDHFVESQRSDGIIIATPTGSTAYALSGGGPILHPSLPASVLVPICTHTFSNRPIVISDESRIQLRVCQAHIEQVRISCDGQSSYSLKADELIHIVRAEHRVRLIHPAGTNHFDIMRQKLNWGSQRA